MLEDKHNALHELTAAVRDDLARAAQTGGASLLASRDAGVKIAKAKKMLVGTFRSWCSNELCITYSWAYKLVRLAAQWDDVGPARSWAATKGQPETYTVEGTLKQIGDWRRAPDGGNGGAVADVESAPARPQRESPAARTRRALRAMNARRALLERRLVEAGAEVPPLSAEEADAIRIADEITDKTDDANAHSPDSQPVAAPIIEDDAQSVREVVATLEDACASADERIRADIRLRFLAQRHCVSVPTLLARLGRSMPVLPLPAPAASASKDADGRVVIRWAQHRIVGQAARRDGPDSSLGRSTQMP
ncbi:hypothetical protein [Paracraurococcus lichenis]|uniref:Uncharacterized protein n=1 Tax=Paracraurococcus lichenis TaxID=3064888 RepID=A0ABT9EBD7_9PROT|nr:hypothetical protein [Paracraurococcus sp. LOR1-02]MDO9713494.1 hypothetical protein [Paracraurococcus sp. LOR1-02]